MSHYFQPEISAEVQEAGLDDWAEALLPFPRQAIEHAARTYIRDQPRRRPTPGDIRHRAAEAAKPPANSPQAGKGDRSKLTHDELVTLDEVLTRAKRWVREEPGLAHHGAKTLDHWSEPIPTPNVLPKTRDEREAERDFSGAYAPRRMTPVED